MGHRRLLGLAGSAASLVLLLPLPLLCEGRPSAVPRTELAHPCSRPIARAVRKELDRQILRPAAKAGLDNWPRGCPFDPARDLWGNHEKSKSRKRGHGALWTCGLSGKVFKNEHYLDLHLERKHMNETPIGGVCLADYCDAFEVCEKDKIKRRPKDVGECNNETMAEKRHQCEQAMAKCFPLANEETRKMNAQLTRELCRVLDCRVRAERHRESSSEMMPVIIWLILIALLCFMVFSLVVCCVDYSDDIFQLLMDSGIASSATVKKLVATREQVRNAGGCDRTKAI